MSGEKKDVQRMEINAAFDGKRIILLMSVIIEGKDSINQEVYQCVCIKETKIET